MKQLFLLAFSLSTLVPRAVGSHTEAVLDRVIQVADKNKDGKIQFEEFKLLDVQARNHGAEHFARGDANRDGVLDRGELAAELAAKQTWFVILCEGVEVCFKRLDTNGDHRLDPAEYRKVSRMGGHSEPHHRGADANKDGYLDLTEFTAHAESKLKSA
ncbi:MAG: EF-hand domain-containing protein, partial [Verrucomicrobiae bacterium]|nr:EF-hand domain-containing protein [Verrucomicrobiae bacterium]